MDSVAERLVRGYLERIENVSGLNDIDERDQYAHYYRSAKSQDLIDAGESLLQEIEALFEQGHLSQEHREDAAFQIGLEMDRLKESCQSEQTSDFYLDSIDDEMVNEFTN